MTAIHQNDILFDDFSILKQLIGQKQVIISSRNTDCDCIGYSSTSSDDNVDTDKITPPTGKAD